MNRKPKLNEFPTDCWVKITIGTARYIGRALSHDRVQFISAIDEAGESATFSWPYICANASSVEIVPFAKDSADACSD